MPNTQSNLTGYRKLHETYLVSDLSDGLNLALSSENDSIAQIGIENVVVRRRFGRRVLHLDVVDRTAFAELHGKPQARQQLKIKLGHTATIGRDKLDLPLLRSQLTISEDHLQLAYIVTENGDSLSVHDYDSINGSHLVNTDALPIQTAEISPAPIDENIHVEALAKPLAKDNLDAQRTWLYGPGWDTAPTVETT